LIRKLIAFSSGSFELTATADLPCEPADATFPSVILCHGFTGNRFESRRLYVRLGRLLAARGIASFRFDHRGCGESEGDFQDFTSDGYLEDLDTALKEFLAQPWADHARTAVVGYSLGGASASYLLSRRSNFSTAVLWAPVAKPGIIRERLSLNPSFEKYRELGYYDLGGFRVSRDYLDRISEVAKPLEWIKNYAGPTLFIHGEDDDIVPPDHSAQYLHIRGNSRDGRIILSNADHAFTSAVNGDLVVQHSLDWITSHLPAA
jgi:uncharacterized protein